ncbi:hypothetical protein DUI87_09435 [Hirundo rustica rustica]|uniref:Uncharacterized protein n=1 Tax=Hirundo rustica rustica TaxID=333673 RepID=A0A3M0KNW9_HIRRU|nr:hypothetical protein DUI87_09435 [Hirundo rustica rustica]
MRGDDYKEHVKCVSEDQKYGGKGFEAKTNKGDAKQQEWIQKIHEVMKKPNISPKVRNILEQMRTFDNIPRKKVKFQISNEKEQDKPQQKEDQQAAETGENTKAEENGITERKKKEPHTKTKRMKTESISEDMETENINDNEENVGADKGKFNWKGTIKAVLKQAPDNEISVKKLRKKVIAQYYAVAGEHHKTEEEILVIFNKKVNNNPKFRVLKDKVKLVK